MRIAVAGARLASRMTVWAKLDELYAKGPIHAVITTRENRTDKYAQEWATARRLPSVIVNLPRMKKHEEGVPERADQLFRIYYPSHLLLFLTESPMIPHLSAMYAEGLKRGVAIENVFPISTSHRRGKTHETGTNGHGEGDSAVRPGDVTGPGGDA